MGLEVLVVGVPHTDCPLLVVCIFSEQNQKMVGGLTNQLFIAFKEGLPN
jgi:hypothetical protein